MTLDSIKQYKHIHMIGIGGVSMSGLAEHLTHFGFKISGSDAKVSDNTLHLQKIGVNVSIGHTIENIKEADLVVYTAAISENDPELIYAKSSNKPMMERGQFLGKITKCYKECICISGTHGKTTTTSMLATTFLKANLDPSIEVGAYLKEIEGNNKTGKSDYFILEACEYVDSFLNFYPHVEIILNIDNDHLDYFKDLEHIKESFHRFTKRLDESGIIVANKDDQNTLDVLEKTNHKKITYGIENKDVDFLATDIKINEYGFPTFTVLKNGVYYETFTLNVHGKHNVLNALATIATSDIYNIPKEIIKESLKNFTGANRRFQKIGEYKKIPVFDDYAHHPTEIKTTVLCSQEIPHEETWAIFEPHTYSRTEAHLKEFASVLAKFDHIIIADIYAAREINTSGISSKDLEKLILSQNKNCIYIKNYEEIINYLKEHVKEKDIIVTIGAGTINQVGYKLIEEKE